MTPEAEDAVFAFLLEQWFSAMDLFAYRGVQEQIKGAWLSRHAPVPSASEYIETPALRARFVDDVDFHAPDLDGYRRFEAEHMSGRSDPERPRSSNWSSVRPGRFHVIGLGRFAEVEGTKNILVETSWGGLFGLGFLVRVTPSGELTVLRELWKS